MHTAGCLKDDPSIPNSELLYRTIDRTQVKEGNAVSSGAFKSRKNPDTSVELGSLATPQETLNRRPSHVGVVKLLTAGVRAIRPGVIGVSRDPIPASGSQPGNPAHAIIFRETTPNRVYEESAYKLAKLCEWVLGP